VSPVVVTAAGPDEWDLVREVRLAALADDPEAFCAVLEREQRFDEAAWRERLASAGTTWLLARGEAAGGAAGVAGEVVGVVASEVVGVVAVEDVDEATADLVSFWVRPEARGGGVGSALIEAGCDLARSHGRTRVTLEVGDHNVRAQRLYARHGFEPTGHTSTMPPPKDHVTEHQLARDL
jgi:ribosomal protein S18 acetylase RimI-like enzyme